MRAATAQLCTTRAMTAGALVLAACGATAAPNEELVARVYPVKSIRFILTSPPGGPADRVTRLIGTKLHEAWHQPIVIDNRPGANGIIGMEKTARAAPDGYTIAMVSAGLAINPSLYTRVPYDPIKDFAAITQVVSMPHVLVVHPAQAFASVAELVHAARAKPGTIVFASAGRGTSGHLALELFQSVAQARFAHVPYKGGTPAMAELTHGQAQASFGIALGVMPYVKAGRLKALAVTSAARSRAVPELPTVAESGYPGYEVASWFGVLAPARTPPMVVTKLNGEIARILHLPEVEQRLIAQAADPVASEPDAFARHIAAETHKWAKLIKQAGIKAD